MEVVINSAGMVLLVLAALMLTALVRALLLRPTAAKYAVVPMDQSERATEYGKQLSRLVQKETVSSRFDPDRTKFLEFHEILAEMFPLLHSTCEKHVFHGSLLFRWKGKGKHEPVLLMSHHDVVEADGIWEHPPFSGDIDAEGRVWGRGTVDTKASLFCLLTAVEELIAEGCEPDCDVYLASSCTEEWSGEGAPATVQYLKEQGVRLGMVLDEGGMILEHPVAGVNGMYGMVGVLEKGYGDLKFTAKSSGGHASVPFRNSPLVRLGKFMAEVERHNPFRAEFNAPTVEMFRRMAPNMSFGMKLIFANFWLSGPLLKRILPLVSAAAGAMLRTTIGFTMAKGADGLNVFPQEAYVTANMRFIPHQDKQESIAVITKLAEKFDLETEVIYANESCPVVEEKAAPFRRLEEVAAEIYPGIGICPYVMTGSTDARYYTEICDHCLRFAPLYISGQQYQSIHGRNENIYQGALPLGVDFYKKMIQKS
ncbi:MAG: M20/M25/M40 family metallo-hydrolase [Lachnospiraceae bacterium]|nr:M20/M25/M40 family metallo-hydrolase [Lachnospiraceae bacterium]